MSVLTVILAAALLASPFLITMASYLCSVTLCFLTLGIVGAPPPLPLPEEPPLPELLPPLLEYPSSLQFLLASLRLASKLVTLSCRDLMVLSLLSTCGDLRFSYWLSDQG